MNLVTKIHQISVGIRYSRSFRIPDISGEIIDDILYNKKSPFAQISLFKTIQESAEREKILINPSKKDYLRVNTDDIIFNIKLENNFEKQYAWIKNDVLNYFKNQLFWSHKIKNITRIGIIFHHKLNKHTDLHESISLLTDNKIQDIENIGVTFSKKLQAIDGYLKKGVDDYKNTIYNLQEVREGLLADFDFQHYFAPEVEDLRDCNTDKFFLDARKYLEDNFYSWLSKYGSKKGY